MASRAAHLLADLVAIPSVNPRGGPVGGEQLVAAYVERWAGHVGVPATLEVVEQGRANVYVEVPGTLPGRVLLQTHSDTVETDGMADPFTLALRDGRWYGRGACDAKGQLAVFLAAIEAVRNVPHHPVLLAVCMDEEEHFRGVTALCASGRLAATDTIGAVVGEPTGLRCVTAHRGVVRGTITATGPGGHSSRATTLPNPIVTMAQVIDHLAGAVAAELLDRHHPLLGTPSLAVTTIHGGEAINIIPRAVTVGFDRRTLPSENPRSVWQDLATQVQSRWPSVTVAEPDLLDPGLDTPAAGSFVAAFRTALRGRALDDDPVGVGFGSDASKIAPLGIACVVFGAGSIEVAHTADEHVADHELSSAVDVIVSCLTSPSSPAGRDELA